MEIKVVSFNIRCVSDPNGNSIPERAPRLNKIISPLFPDLIGFQEWRPEWKEHIIEYFGEKYEIFNVFRAENDPESVPVLWKKDRFRCIKKGNFWLSDTPEIESGGWDEIYNCCRICVYAVLEDKASGKIFTFMNTHFGFGDKGQAKSSELIYNYSKKISKYPTLITGDFNMSPNSIGYKTMTKFFSDVNTATAADLRATYHDYNSGRFIDDEINRHIDYCFISDKIKPVSQRIIDETVNGKFPSDHYGLETVIDI